MKILHHFPFAMLLLCIGCQAYVAKPLDAEANATRFSTRRLDDPEVRMALVNAKISPRKWPPSSWNLRQLKVVALHFHPEIAVARAKAVTTRAAITTADTAPNPSLAFTPEIGDAKSALSPWLLGFALDFPIEKGVS